MLLRCWWWSGDVAWSDCLHLIHAHNSATLRSCAAGMESGVFNGMSFNVHNFKINHSFLHMCYLAHFVLTFKFPGKSCYKLTDRPPLSVTVMPTAKTHMYNLKHTNMVAPGQDYLGIMGSEITTCRSSPVISSLLCLFISSVYPSLKLSLSPFSFMSSIWQLWCVWLLSLTCLTILASILSLNS